MYILTRATFYAGSRETFEHKVQELEQQLQKSSKAHEKLASKCSELQQQLVDKHKGETARLCTYALCALAIFVYQHQRK